MERLFYNGTIITMEDSDLSHQPEAILVKAGKIAAKGSLEAMKQKASSKVAMKDLQGMCLMPAFIDPHSHIVMNGQMSIGADLSGCNSLGDVIATLKTFIEKQKVKPGQLVMGFGYDHNFFNEKAHPDKITLDQVSLEHPIMILHVSGHVGCVNSALIDYVGLKPGTPDPQGGHYGRLEDGQELSGYCEEAAIMGFQAKIKKIIKPDIIGMLKNMQNVYLQYGVTTAQDGAATRANLMMLKMMSLFRMLKIDIVIYPLMGTDADAMMAKNWKKYKNYHKHIKIGGYKLVLDGSPQGKTAWVSQPYEGETHGYCGYPWMKTEEVNKFLLQAVREKKQVLVHCNGDASGDQFLDGYEAALKQTGITEDLRPVMIHCQTARNDQLDRMAKLKMIASVFVGHVWFWGDIHLKNLGSVRGNHISPVKDALDRGISVNLHQDTPVTKPNMMHSVWCAVNRISREGQVVGADQAVSVYDALKMVTINGAYQYFEENSKGSIKEGKRADFVILDRSPLAVDPFEIREIKVMETIKDGVSLWKR